MRYLGLPELFLFLPLILAASVFYLLSLHRALFVCAPENRALAPALVWLLLVPVFNLFWHFVVVTSVSRSLGKEFRRRQAGNASRAALPLGLGMCVLSALALAPVVTPIATLGALVCWIAYWIKVAHDSRALTLSGSPQGSVPGRHGS
jgi:hypothetical protein